MAEKFNPVKVGFAAAILALALPLAVAARAAGCGGADQAALAWLDRMSRSLHQVSYHGVVTLQRGEDMQVMQVSHAVDGENSFEQLTQLTGQGAQVERTDHPLHCVHPGHRLLQLGAELKAGNCGIAEHYRFRVDEGERIAGRKAVRIRIEPRDMYRFGYVMELDRETGLLLKTQTVGRGDKVLEKFQFASLSYEHQPPVAAEVDVVHRARHPNPSVPEHMPGSWSIDWVPTGFTYTDAPESGAGRRTYTDGLAVFSVFLEELGREIRPGEGVVRSGGTTSYTRGMELTGKPVLVTVIGEVPVNTARMVADSVGWER
ncbi:MAG: negative regulator for alginate biosynthesis [Haliea sp.]|nr:negative regulator for alginate biosynthesis [Haliea sp.]